MDISRNLLLAIIQYLTELNKYASEKNSGDFTTSVNDVSCDLLNEKYKLIHYNVGGVISIVDRLKKSLGDQKDDLLYPTKEPSVLLSVLKSAWFIESGSINNDIVPTTKSYFNSAFDPTCTLNYIIAQVLQQVSQSYNDPFSAQLFEVCENLLVHYSSFIIFQDENKPVTFLIGDEYKRLQSTFERFVELKNIEMDNSLKRIQELRREGNEIFKQGSFGPAIAKFTEALILDPSNYMLYSNRAAAYTYLSSHEHAIDDLLKAVEIKPDFETAWTRLGFSYLGRGKPMDSMNAYVKAIQLAYEAHAVPHYLIKLSESFKFARDRALQRGNPSREVNKLYESISPILKEIENMELPSSRIPTGNGNSSSPQPSQTQNTPQPQQQQPGSQQQRTSQEHPFARFIALGMSQQPQSQQQQRQPQDTEIQEQQQQQNQQADNAPRNTTPEVVSALNALGSVLESGNNNTGGNVVRESNLSSLTVSLDQNGHIISSSLQNSMGLPGSFIISGDTSATTTPNTTTPNNNNNGGNNNVNQILERLAAPLADGIMTSVNIPDGLRNMLGNAIRNYTNQNNDNNNTNNANNNNADNSTNTNANNAPESTEQDEDLDLD